MAGGYNGSGTFVRARNCQNDEANSIGIEAVNIDEDLDTIASGLSVAFPRDGQAAATANWNIGGFRLTNVGTPTTTGDAATKGYIDIAVQYIGNIGTVGYYSTNGSSISAVKVSFQGKSGGNDSYVTVDGDNWSSSISYNALNSASKQIRAAVITGELASQTANSETGRLRFWTKPSTGAALERMRLDHDGQAYIGTTLSGSTTISGFAICNLGDVNGFIFRGWQGSTQLFELGSDGGGYVDYVAKKTNSGLRLNTNSAGSNVIALTLSTDGDATFIGAVTGTTITGTSVVSSGAVSGTTITASAKVNAATGLQVASKDVFAASAYIDFTVSGTTPTDRRSKNIASVTRVSAGIYALTFTTAATDAYYTVVGNGGATTSGSVTPITVSFTDKTTAGFRAVFTQVNVALYDPPEASITVFGG